VIRETSDLIEECGDGSFPSEAHCGGWEGLGKDGGGTNSGAPQIIYASNIYNPGNFYKPFLRIISNKTHEFKREKLLDNEKIYLL